MPRLTIEEPGESLKDLVVKDDENNNDWIKQNKILDLYDNAGIRTAVGLSRLTGVSAKAVSKILKAHRPEYSEYCAHLTGKTPVDHINYKKELAAVLENRIKSVLSPHELDLYKGLIRKD